MKITLPKRAINICGIFLVLLLSLLTVKLNAQTAEIPFHYETFIMESGIHNGNGIISEGATNVFSGIVEIKGIPWLNIHFESANLGQKSYISLTSLLDGHKQILNSVTLEQWNYYSAFFNGDAVKLELFVDPLDQNIFINVDEVIAGDWENGMNTESICGPTDDRIHSDQPATGRLMSIGCTGWIIPNGKLISAGHCFASPGGNIMEFNVPLSLAGGTVQHPGPEDQYSVNPSSIIYVSGGIGNDYGVFEVHPNSITNLMPKEAQGAFFVLAQDYTSDSIRITGYGVDGGTANQTQQTHIGPNMGSSGYVMRYQTDTEGGNSGSPIIDGATGVALGVHTHGGCNSSGGNNNGTSFYLTAFWDAVDHGAGANPDTVGPSTIVDLTVADVTSNSITLNWTAPNDTSAGGVIAYDLRYSNSAILDTNDFNTATPIPYPSAPASAGTPESFTVNGIDFNSTYYFAIRSHDLWFNWSDVSNSPSGTTLGAPEISVTPGSLAMTLYPAMTATDTVFISNISSNNSTLDFTLSLENNTFPDEAGMQVKLLPLTEGSDRGGEVDKNNPNTQGGISFDGSGGPDDFGYSWIDSDELNGPVYQWTDISGTGTLVTAWTATGTYDPKDEGYAGPFALGFDFSFYGINHSNIYISSNGILTFSSITSDIYSNASIPSTSLPNDLIAPFWDDLDGSGQGNVYYLLDGNKFIIQFDQWQQYPTTGSLTFQIVLYSNGNIIIYYNNLSGTLNSNTVGIENGDGTIGLQVAYNSNYISNDRALQFSAEPDWLQPNILGGTIYNGNSVAVELTFASEDFVPGDYSMDVVINSNDPVTSIVTVPVTMQILPVPVELTMFNAEVSTEGIELQWTTATETNNRGFDIERKEGEGNWSTVAFLEGKGTTTATSSYRFIDSYKLIQKAGELKYRLKQIDLDGSINYSDEITVSGDLVPEIYSLEQNYPNPFNPATTIRYTIPELSRVRIEIYNILGEKISELINKEMEAGYYELNWDASGMSTGVYIYLMEAASKESGTEFREIKKMMLMK